MSRAQTMCGYLGEAINHVEVGQVPLVVLPLHVDQHELITVSFSHVSAFPRMNVTRMVHFFQSCINMKNRDLDNIKYLEPIFIISNCLTTGPTSSE